MATTTIMTHLQLLLQLLPLVVTVVLLLQLPAQVNGFAPCNLDDVQPAFQMLAIQKVTVLPYVCYFILFAKAQPHVKFGARPVV